MRKALVQSDGRVAQIEDAANIFPVAPPLQWLDCADNVDTTYTYSNGQLVAPAAPALDFNSKKYEIEAWRDAACFADVAVPVGGTTYHWQVDARSLQLIAGAIDAAINAVAPLPPTWRSSENVDVPITLADMKNIAAAAASQTLAAYQHSFQLKAQLDAAKTQADLDVIKW